MKLQLYIKLAWLLGLPGLVLAQQALPAEEVPHRFFLGIDLSKNATVLITKSSLSVRNTFLVELPAAFPLNGKGLYGRVTPGYARFSDDKMFGNLRYRCEGFSLKAGLEHFSLLGFTLGGSLVAAVGEEWGAYVLPGPFYGDAVFPVNTRRLYAGGVEAHLAYWFLFGKRFFLSPEVRVNLYAAPPLDQIEFRYIPGIGTASRMQPGGGISVRAGFAFPVRKAPEQ